MDNKLIPIQGAALTPQAADALMQCNELTAKFGLMISEQQIQNLSAKRLDALKNTGRIEFGEGILKKLIVEFCDSPYICQENYEETLQELQDVFYYFKNESLDAIGDDDLLRCMKASFDGECEGSLDYLRETMLEDLCRKVRFGYNVE